MTIAMAIVTFVGFARTYYLRAAFPEIQEFAAQEGIFQLHGALCTLWFLLLVTQALLIRQHQLVRHQALGMFGVLLAATLIVVGVYAAVVAAARPGGFIGVPVPPEQFLAVPFFDLVMFGVFFTLAVRYRRNPQAHKRLILFATINILTAAVARVPLAVVSENFPVSTFVGPNLFVLAIIAWDLVTTKRLHAVTIWASVLTIGVQVGRLIIMGTEPWTAFSGWLIDLLT